MPQTTGDFINALAEQYGAKTYLEIGVFEGKTFFDVTIQQKTAVDPSFQFNYLDHASDTTFFFETTSDTYFEELAQNKYVDIYGSPSNQLKFDIVYIDGLHTFEQSLRDFLNATLFSHDNTIFIFDDTCPSDCFSAMTENLSLVLPYRRVAQLTSQEWQGDVFKTILAIHDLYKNYSYCTNISIDNPQTIVWKTPLPSPREILFGSHKDIEKLRYEDFLKYGWALMPVEEQQIPNFLTQRLVPRLHRTGREFLWLIKPAITANEMDYKQYIEQLHTLLESSQWAIKDAMSRLESQAPDTAQQLGNLLRQL